MALPVPAKTGWTRWGELRGPVGRFYVVVAAAVLLFGTVGSVAVASQWHTSLTRSADQRLQRQIANTTDRLQAVVLDDSRALTAEKALFAATADNVSLSQFRSFVASFGLAGNYPGLLSLSFIQVVPGADLPAFVAANRADGRPGFTVTPPGARSEYWVVRYSEPQAIPPWGGDARSNLTIQPFLQQAEDSGQLTLSGASVLTNDLGRPTDKPVAFGLFDPIYRPGVAIDTVAQRRAAIVGWVAAPLRAQYLLANYLRVSPGVGLQVYDNSVTASNLVAAAPAGFRATGRDVHTVSTAIAGRRWVLRFAALPGVNAQSSIRGPAAALAAGVGLSVLLAGLLWLYGATTAQRSRSAEQLRQSEFESRRNGELFRSAFDDALVGMTLVAPDGTFLRVNTAFATMLDRNRDELVGMNFRDTTHPDDAAQDEDAVSRSMAGAGGMVRQKRYTRPDGSTVYAELSTRLVRDSAGEPLHFATQYVDVSSRRIAEQERDTQAAMLRAVIASSQALVYVKALDGTYLFVNEPFQQRVGMTEAELLGHDDTVISQELAPIWRANDLLARHGEIHVEECGDIPEGQLIYESVKFPLHDSDGKVYAICGTSMDVAQRRLVNAELAEAAAVMEAARDTALEATRAKSAFLATMSHEIRTPMNAVIGMTELLLHTDLTAEQREFLDTVRASGDTLLTIINDILDLSKIEAGELTLDQQPFALRECVESALSLVSLQAEVKGLELIADISQDCPQLLVGDVTRFRQVITNLVSNAVKFTANGEVAVIVSATPAPVPASYLATGSDVGDLDGGVPGMLVEVAVRDTGIGIPADRMDRLFQPFSQVDASTTREYGGTGLGLVISRRLAQAMGGDLTVSSAPGVGSTFTMTLAVGVAADRREPTDNLLAGRSVLLVDDNATIRRVLSAKLRGWGMTCIDVDEPEAALELMAGSGQLDIALIDMHMPGMDGQQLSRAIRDTPRGRDLPLILLSGFQTRLDPQAQAMFAAVLTKPPRNAALLDTLLAVLTPAAMAVKALETAGGQRRDDGPPLSTVSALRVLLAEDNLVNQRVAQLMLSKHNHLVDTVNNGQEALEAVHRNDYDVILMDVQMPILDGLTATARIRAELFEERQPYIVALTASTLTEDRTAAAAAGVDAFLSKPVRQSDLDSALAEFTAQGLVGARVRRRTPSRSGHS